MLYEIKEINEREFVRQMLVYTDRFTQEGLEALFYYLNNLSNKLVGGKSFINHEQITNEWIEGDLAYFSFITDVPLDNVLDFLENRTTVIEVDADKKVYIVQSY